MFQVTEKLKLSRHKLQGWSKTHFGSIHFSIAKKTELLKQEEECDPQVQDSNTIKQLRVELSVLFIKEEKMWKQRSRSSWLKSGDHNTHFFHCQATHRRRRNYIRGIRNNDGVWQSLEPKIEHTIVDYYKNLFASSNPRDFDEVLEGVDQVVNEDMNALLAAEFTTAEIEHAIFQMGLLKLQDSMVCLLFSIKKYWNIVGPGVVARVLSYLQDGVLLRKINHTNICLIPKGQNPETIKDF